MREERSMIEEEYQSFACNVVIFLWQASSCK